ncbi:Oligopeptide transport ATP-binding protein [Oenococcus kitaharae DSM 17330]|uniref:Oligopeptide transport ATP-binding protein n=1 Tax=Oenococcus kitaharae DSM 17330 TaxID=1045004 RepID=G9WHI8_9LACO|nr:Oligopeptide transport ATP-binding protein [Oenococcus kitaharae DSM 17330]OEY81503.1 peptide ABC transporter ATPase [Oenococcus kitaharae]OEY82990.1 peptide ABC transporter ATPase [Oenococcus kitaharae]OEY84465.1 peptide ABC transporter ATPase [Oenococcus kitaharae]
MIIGKNLLEAKGVGVDFRINGEWLTALYNVDLSVKPGEVLALVGESGSGKSTFAMSVMALHNPNQSRVTGSIMLDGHQIVDATEAEMRELRGVKVGMIFQDPLSALNPLMKIGDQIQESMSAHSIVPKEQWQEHTIKLLDEVGISKPELVADQFPHELSGGMRQRVMIAIAIANEPDLLIADEPTTALDVTIQAQILDLIKEIQAEKNIGVLLITHDLGVVAEMADSVAVMYAGQIVERGTAEQVFENPLHPYTRSLLRANPSLDTLNDQLYVIPGVVPALSEMDHSRDLFLERVPWMQEAAKEKVSDVPAEPEEGHFVRGNAWKDFKFQDGYLEPGRRQKEAQSK